MIYTYLLRSKKDNKWYTGITNDLLKRFNEHNSNKVFSTKHRGPFELIYYEACMNEKDARMREKYLKTGMGKRFLKNRLNRFLFLTGMTFIEVLIAIVISAVVLSSMLAGLNFANKYNQHNANKTMALNFAQELMEEIKNKSYDDLHATDTNYHTGSYTNFLGPEVAESSPYIQNDDDNDSEDGSITKNEFDDIDDYNGYQDIVNIYQNANVSVSATRDVVIRDQNGNNVLDHAGFLDVDYKEITVSVSWTWLGTNYNESISTIVAYWRNEA